MIVALAELIERALGLALDRGGVSGALERFVAERLRVLGLAPEAYVARAADPASGELRRIADVITVPHTWFYRDAQQLETVAQLLRAAPTGPIAVWVAGCATGEEAYTLAMIGRRIGRELAILATDINEAALDVARRGVYGALAVREVPESERHWLVESNGAFEVSRVLRAGVTFARHNLADPPPERTVDLVMCRNVLIYFSPRAGARVLERFTAVLRDGGALVLGASEIVREPPAGLSLGAAGCRLVLRRSAPAIVSEPVAAAHAPVPVRAPAIAPRIVTTLTRGHALFERGDIAAALDVYTALARDEPALAEAWLFLGIARYTHGDIEGACLALRASLCLDPALWPAEFYLARTYERLGRAADALHIYDAIAVGRFVPLLLQSQSSVINELRALQHDVQTAARRISNERGREKML